MQFKDIALKAMFYLLNNVNTSTLIIATIHPFYGGFTVLCL